MCLYKRIIRGGANKKTAITNCLKTSGNDITCYKVIKRNHNWFPFSGVTPYRYTPVSLKMLLGRENLSSGYSGSELISKLISSTEVIDYSGEDFTYVFGEGLIHTFKKRDDAFPETYGCRGENFDIWECIIPAGVQYVEGNVNEEYEGYGSAEIKFIRRIRK